MMNNVQNCDSYMPCSLDSQHQFRGISVDAEQTTQHYTTEIFTTTVMTT
jgi:hypothetical protein